MRVHSQSWFRSLPLILALPFVLQCRSTLQPDALDGTPTYDYRQLSQKVATLDLGLSPSYHTRGDQHGNRIAVTQTETVSFIDTEDPVQPRIIQSVALKSWVRDLELTESHLYLVSNSRLQILDRGDLLGAPVGQLIFPDREYPGEILVDQECFLAARYRNQSWLYVINVDDVQNPTILSKVTFEADITDLAREGDLLVAGTYRGAVFLDISNPLQVEIVSEVPVGNHVAIRNGFAYLAHSGYRGGMSVYDVGDPRNPLQVGGSSAPSSSGKMTLEGDRLYARIEGQVAVFDISNPQQPREFLSLASSGWGDLFVREGHVWSLGHNMVVHEVNEEVPPLLGERTLSVYWVLGADQNRVVGYGQDGVFDLSLEDPTLSSPPTVIDNRQRSGAVVGNKLYLWQFQPQIDVYDLSSRRIMPTVDLSTYLFHPRDRIAWIGGRQQRLYVLVNDEISTRYELLVFDIASAGPLTFAGRLPVEGDPEANLQGVAIEAQTLYVLMNTGLGNGLLDVLDLSNVYRPKLLSRVPIDGPGNRLTCYQEHLYVGSGHGLLTFDVRIPETPVRMSLVQNLNNLRGLVAKDNMLYAIRSSEMVIMDLSRRGRPVEIASRGYSSTNPGRALFATDRYLFVARSKSVEALPLHASQR